jgi:hypothetical protein
LKIERAGRVVEDAAVQRPARRESALGDGPRRDRRYTGRKSDDKDGRGEHGEKASKRERLAFGMSGCRCDDVLPERLCTRLLTRSRLLDG